MALTDAVAGEKKPTKKKPAKKPAAKKAAKKPAAKKPAAAEAAAPKKTAKKKPAAPKEAKIIPIAQGKVEEPVAPEETQENVAVNSLTKYEDFRLPALEIDGQKALSFSMAQLDGELTKAHQAVTENDYQRAVVICHQLKNGKYQELDYNGASEYYSKKFGVAFKIAMRYQKIIWFLRTVIGLNRDDALQKLYVNIIPHRVDTLIGFVSMEVISPEQAKEEMAFCVQDSGKGNEEWAMYMKERYGKALAQAKKEAGGSDGLIKVNGFKVDEVGFDVITQAQKIASKLHEKSAVPMGDAVVMAAQHFVSHYGEGMVDVAQTISAIEKAHGLVLIPLPLPGSKAVPNVSGIKVYEKDGTMIFMDSKRAAAKHFGVQTGEVKEVAIDPRPYLHNLGYAEKPKPENQAPKTLDQLTDEEAMERVAGLLKDLGMSRKDWTDKAVGKSIRQQLTMLLELKEKKISGEPVLIDGKTPDKKKAAKKKAAKAAKEKEESSATNLDEAEEKAKAKKSKKSSGKEKGLKPKPEPEPEPEPEEEEDEGEPIFEGEGGKFYLDEALTIECDEYGEPVKAESFDD